MRDLLGFQERREIEMELRRQQEEAEKAKEAKEAANKKEKMRLMKEQVYITSTYLWTLNRRDSKTYLWNDSPKIVW